MTKTIKLILIISLGLAVLSTAAFFGLRIYTKSFSKAQTVTSTKEGFKASLLYSRPAKKGREIFGKLVPFNQVWRTGANEATEITFEQDVVFGGKPVKKGTYALFTIPNADSWTVILNSVLGQWGHFTYDQSKDVLRTEITPEKTTEMVEVFTIAFEPNEAGTNLLMRWDDTQVSVPITK